MFFGNLRNNIGCFAIEVGEEEKTSAERTLSESGTEGAESLSAHSSAVETKPLLEKSVSDDKQGKFIDFNQPIRLADTKPQTTFTKGMVSKKIQSAKRRRDAHREKGVSSVHAPSHAVTRMSYASNAGAGKTNGSPGAWSITEIENKLSNMKVEPVSSGRRPTTKASSLLRKEDEGSNSPFHKSRLYNNKERNILL